MKRQRPRLASRLLIGQIPVIAAGALIPVIVAGIVAPRLFHEHLARAGVADAESLMHAEAAFASSLAIAISVGFLASLLVAGIVAWVLVRSIATPVERLAKAADGIASGEYIVSAPSRGFARELQQLDEAFFAMADRLATTDSSRRRLLGDLAHELRTPLATLQAYIDGLEDGVIATDAEAWDTMRLQVERLRRLATDLREVSDAEEHALGMTMAPLDAAETLQSVVTALRPRFDAKGVTLTLDPGVSATIRGDELRLHQVLTNILDNALRHTPPGGSVTATTARRGTAVVWIVRDTGDGLPAHELERVFERFHRVDPARPSTSTNGSGLGLTIALAIVREHAGTITASSPGPGLGCTFEVRLPGSSLRA